MQPRGDGTAGSACRLGAADGYTEDRVDMPGHCPALNAGVDAPASPAEAPHQRPGRPPTGTPSGLVVGVMGGVTMDGKGLGSQLRRCATTVRPADKFTLCTEDAGGWTELADRQTCKEPSSSDCQRAESAVWSIQPCLGHRRGGQGLVWTEKEWATERHPAYFTERGLAPAEGTIAIHVDGSARLSRLTVSRWWALDEADRD